MCIQGGGGPPCPPIDDQHAAGAPGDGAGPLALEVTFDSDNVEEYVTCREPRLAELRLA